MKTLLYYLHDPMCSWCWGYSPTWKRLQEVLPYSIAVQYVAGGLAPDSNEPMPVSQQEMIQQHWRTIEQKLGTVFNYDFWQRNTPRRSTYNACRAAIAANNQGFQPQMIAAIQQGYYLQALNPSDRDVLISLATQLNKADDVTFDLPRFINDFQSKETNTELTKQIDFARTINRQGFPSLVLASKGQYLPVKLDYLNAETSLVDILAKL